MWTIQINDGFCTWEYKLSSDHSVVNTSIAGVVNAITKETGLMVKSAELVSSMSTIDMIPPKKVKFQKVFEDEV